LPAGPIPADAGEPDSDHCLAPCSRAYPRGRGGAGEHRQDVPGRVGLSPRTRGSRAQGDDLPRLVGPIPADAGEPTGCATPRSRVGPIPADAGEPAGGPR